MESTGRNYCKNDVGSHIELIIIVLIVRFLAMDC